MALEPGKLLSKRYQVLEIIGAGETNHVYHAFDVLTNTDVAVKENCIHTEEYARQFRLEAVVLANLRHPNLPRLTDHFVSDDKGEYMVMEYIDGEDLHQRIERTGNLAETEAILLGAAVCDVLTYLHTCQPAILHRNIKPNTIRISSEGKIFLVGFGLVKVLHGSQPPEPGKAHTDARTDIYSLGATLYTALSSTVPEDGLSRAMDSVSLTPLVKRNSKVSPSLCRVIEKALAIDPGDRFQSAEEFKKALLKCRTDTGPKKDHKWLSWFKR